MAQVPYQPVSEVQPDATPPNDYQRVEANPSSFGGAIAQGAEKAGAGAIDLSKTWGRVQAQDAINNAEQDASNLLVHAKSLQGQDALDAQASLSKQLGDIQTKYRSQLGSTDAQLQFDSTTTPFINRFIRGSLDTHFVDQGRVVASNVNAKSFDNAITMATQAGSDGSSDPTAPTFWAKNVEVARAKAFMAAKTDAVQKGLWDTPDAQQAAEQKANVVYSAALEARALTKPDEAWARLQDPKVKAQLGESYDKTFKNVQETVARSYVSKADAMAVDDPTHVEQFVRDNQVKFGPAYGEVLERANRANINAGGKAAADKALSDVSTGWKGSAASLPASDPGLQPGYTYEKAAFGHESGGNAATVNNTPYTDQHGVYHAQGTGASGLFQFLPSTARAVASQHPELDLKGEWWHDASPAGVAMQKRAFAAFTHDNRSFLQKNGIDPNDKNAFMASFMGAGGATKFIKAAQQNPNASAASLFPTEAAANSGVFYAGGPGGSKPRTLAQVYTLMTRKFSGRATIAPGMAEPATQDIPDQNFSLAPDQSASAETTPDVQAAAFAPAPPAVIAPETPPDPVNAAYEAHALALQHVDSQAIPPAEKEAAKRELDSRLNFALAAANEQARAIKAREDEASDDVLGTARKEGYPAAYQKLNAYMNDPKRPIDEKHFDTLNDVLERRSGNPNPISYGSKYVDALKSIVEPKDETQRISDPRELYRMEADGELTAKGTDHLLSVLGGMKKSTSELGMQQRETGALSYAKDYLDKSVNEPYYQVKDPEGKGIYELKFVNMFYGELDNWRNAGKNMADFPLFDQKNLDQMLQTLRPRSKLDQFKMHSNAAQGAHLGAPLPAAPSNVNPEGWNSLMSMVRPGANGVVNHTSFAQHLAQLAADPERMAPLWNSAKSGIGKALPAEKALEMMGVPYHRASIPEGVGTEAPSAPGETPYGIEMARQRADVEKSNERVSGVAKTVGDFLNEHSLEAYERRRLAAEKDKEAKK